GSPTRGRGSTGLAGSRRAADRHECARGWGKRLSGGGNGRLRRAPRSSAGKRSRRRGARRLERRRRGRPWTVALRRGARPPALGLAAAARRAPEVSRVWLRAAALALVVIGVVVGLTVYFSSESTPPCLVSGAATWRPPSDGGTHRYEVVFPERAACFFAIDEQQRLVGALRLGPAKGISTAAPLQNDVALRAQRGVYTLDLRTGRLRFGGLAPFPSDTLTATDDSHRVLYVTQRGLLGFRVLDSHSGRQLYVVHYRGFTWNRRFGPDPPSHGLSLAPDRPELWVLDSPNSVVHLFDVSGLPNDPPRQIADIRLSK